MEYIFYKYFDGAIYKLENFLFGSNPDLSHCQAKEYYPGVVKQVKNSDPDFLDHLDLEVFFYFLCNVIGLSITLPSFLFIHHSWMLLFMSILILTIHILIITAKLVLLRRIFIIRECSNQSQANQRLWSFFHSKAFKFNKKASNVMFFVYIISFATVLILKENVEDSKNFLKLLSLLFVFSAFSRFWSFMTRATHFQGSEALFQAIERDFTQSIHSLEILSYKKYMKKRLRVHSDTCSICFEDYEDQNILRIMGCSASHAFHKVCVDKWLVDSCICPVCRENVLMTKKMR